MTARYARPVRARPPFLALAFALAFAACASPKPPPTSTLGSGAGAASASIAPEPYVGALERMPKDADRVSLLDRPVRPDGRPDFCFRVRLSGAVRALYVTWTDGAGRSLDHLQWDTRTGAAPFPPAIGSNFREAGQTAAIAVVDARGALLNPDGELPETTFRDEELSLYMADPRGDYFVAGHAYTLWVERPSGQVDRSSITLL